MSKPTTEARLNRASRSLLSEMHPCPDRDNAHSTPGGTWHMSRNRMESLLAAIEAEARADALRELRAKVERLSPMGRDDYLITALDGTTRRPTTPADWVESYRVTVLAAIDEMLPDGLLVTRKDLNEHDYPGDTRQFDTHQRKEADHE